MSNEPQNPMMQQLQQLLAQYPQMGQTPGAMPMMPPTPQMAGMPVPQVPQGGFVGVPVKIHEPDGRTTKATIMVPGMDYWQAKQAVEAMGYEVDSWTPKPRDGGSYGGGNRGGGYGGNRGGYGGNQNQGGYGRRY